MPHHMGCLISTSSEETTSGTWNPTSSFLFILLFDLMQAIHRHIPIIIGALGPLYPELLSIISDPPEGSENLLTQVGSFSIFFLPLECISTWKLFCLHTQFDFFE